MLDKQGRSITYMRLSVTERCNLRCLYCMPADGIFKKSHHDMLTEDEMICAVRAGVSLGITKLRISGGEPLVKENILSICQRVSQIDGLQELCMTTNGILLPTLAEPLRRSGVKRLNLSLDTLKEEKYAYITRIGTLKDFRKGLDAALTAGFEKVKINVVLIGGFNDDEIGELAALTMQAPLDVRFIEMMPMYDSGDFGPEAFIPVTRVLEHLPQAQALAPDGGVARLYQLPGALGRIGLISPVHAHFCSSCNRIRLTADGKLKPCLHAGDEFSIKGMDYHEMRRTMEQVIWNKPVWHGALDAAHRSCAGRTMNQIGG